LIRPTVVYAINIRVAAYIAHVYYKVVDGTNPAGPLSGTTAYERERITVYRLIAEAPPGGC